MQEVRANISSGERLFDYDSSDGTITIAKKKRKYTVKLLEDYNGKRYKVTDVINKT